MYDDINAELVFRKLADTLAHSGQRNFFQLLVERLESILKVDHVMLSEFTYDTLHARTLQVRSKNQWLDNFSYQLQGTPCGQVQPGDPLFINHGICQLFPDDRVLKELEAESYMGMAILSPDGKPIGVLCILQNSPMSHAEIGREVLRIAVAQISAEFERKRNEARILELAFQDKLTRLPNRSKLHEHLAHVVEQSPHTQGAIGLIIIDLKRFKEVNYTYGHIMGDKLLVAVAGRLKSQLGADLFVARQASDEYAVIDTDASLPKMRQLVEQVNRVFSEPFTIMQTQLEVEVNIGASLLPHDSDTADELFQHACIALDEAKTESLGQCIYDASMAERLYRKHRVLNQLTHALNNGSLDVHLQPQFCVKTGKVFGAEALSRWTDDELGPVSPAEFVPIAEERGLIQQLDRLVLRKVGQQLSQWRKQGIEFPGRISINLSAQQFESVDVVEKLGQLTQEVGATSYTLELTEGVMMRKPEEALVVTQMLKKYGFDIAVDDFGTGYSSLAYLQQLSIQWVKIDRSFVRDLNESEQNKSIVKAIIAMAHSLGMKTVAEGVETKGQAMLLKELGCDFLQGFFLGRPVSKQEFEKKWLTASAASTAS
ncbi:histidine kinase [Aliidiomarina taiwanensis]|uniref:Histidine kinase n=1 Tax=Aliidiomarina taiwanensis TaxID=946228 RepID=A0A432XA64_9GAMM|nr:sensor domain-containing phosphodiesterase [Aliidiomarina taiwanensis]RUO44302.1 histidine kinase [Aliidiomarina taiwanensis]